MLVFMAVCVFVVFLACCVDESPTKLGGFLRRIVSLVALTPLYVGYISGEISRLNQKEDTIFVFLTVALIVAIAAYWMTFFERQKNFTE